MAEKKPKKAVAVATEPAKQEKKISTTSLLLLFKVAGSNTWRKNFYPTKEALDVYLSLPGQAKHAVITEKKWFVIDQLKGSVTEDK